MMLNKAVFLDKDGTLIEDVPYNVDPEQIRLMPGVESLRSLHQLGYQLIVISNQSGVARGYFPESALVGVEAKLRSLLLNLGIPLAGFYYCPHYPVGSVSAYTCDCDCRKPAPGMILKATHIHQLDLTQSWFIGDILHDMEAGNRAGCRTILLNNGHETEWDLSGLRSPNFTVKNLTEASEIIQNFTQASGHLLPRNSLPLETINLSLVRFP